jgi:hypothetical protein
MTAVHARLILETLADHHIWQGDREAVVFVNRAAARLPVVERHARRAAWEQLHAAHLLRRTRRGTAEDLTPAGVVLARQVGYAVHAGAALPCLPEVAQ